MPIRTEDSGPVTVLRFDERLTRFETDVELGDVFRRLLDEGRRRFLFDFRGTRYIDSAVLGETVACLKRAREQDGAIKLLVTRGGKVDQLLRLLVMHRLFDIHHTEADALAGFA